MPAASSESTLSTCACPSCGLSLSTYGPLIDTQTALAAAQAQIDDLQAQVRLLGQKAAAAADRWADYEDELARLRARVATPSSAEKPEPQISTTTTTIAISPAPGPAPTPSPTRTSFLSTSTTRISALLSPRKSVPTFHPSPAPVPPPQPPPAPTEADLLAALSREQNLRRAAEKRVSATSREVEELSASLFEQANEMVASERRARARLEERVEVLERRDADKGRRLERLEGAVERIERVRKLLGQDGVGGGVVGEKGKGA